MEIAFHVGVNGPEGDRLLKSLLSDVGTLSEAGIAVPGPSRYRDPLRTAVNVSTRVTPGPGLRDALIQQITGGAEAERLVLSQPAFLGAPGRVFEGGRFMGVGVAKVAALHSIFPHDRIELHLGLRNPATWLPGMWRQVPEGPTFEAWLHGGSLDSARWSDVVIAMRQVAPTYPITLWYAEDMPFLWREILSRLIGPGWSGVPSGRFDLAETILTRDGAAALRRYVAERAPSDVTAERRMLAAFLDRFARPEEAWVDLQVPEWVARSLDGLTAAYEADVERLAQLDGVTLLRP